MISLLLNQVALSAAYSSLHARRPALWRVSNLDIRHGGANGTRCQLRGVFLATVCMPESHVSRSSYQMRDICLNKELESCMAVSLGKKFRVCEVPPFFASVPPSLRSLIHCFFLHAKVNPPQAEILLCANSALRTSQSLSC
jgi:hypothetical protein